jgi:hypothetical protein
MYDRLNEVESLWNRLPDSAHRPTGVREPGRSMSVYPGLPGNGNVINLTAAGAETPLGRLRAVEDDWRRAAGLPVQAFRGSAGQTMPLVLGFLRGRLPWACAAHKNPRLLDGEPLLPDVQALHEALGRIVGDLGQAVTGEPRARTIPVVCGAQYADGSVCDGVIRVGAHTLRTMCADCGAEWTRDHLVAMAAGLGAAA